MEEMLSYCTTFTSEKIAGKIVLLLTITISDTTNFVKTMNQEDANPHANSTGFNGRLMNQAESRPWSILGKRLP